MNIGAAVYGYRNNFGCKVSPSQKKGRTTKIKLFYLIVDYYRAMSKYDDDYFISIAQYFMKKGYPHGLTVTENIENINGFFMKALFSISPFHYEDLWLNQNKFDLGIWRKQFQMFEETELKGLNFYRNRSSMPLENFTSLRNIYKIILSKYGPNKETNEQLKFCFNSHWEDAVWILMKSITVTKDRLYYKIEYGCKDDHEDMLANRSHSSWTITIESELDENYVDFCCRISRNYAAIISGSQDVLISKRDGKDFYLSGHFKLKITENGLH